MEKIKEKSDIEKLGLTEEPKPLKSGIKSESREIIEPGEFEEEWKNSIFNDARILEQISEEMKAIEKDYEYSDEELAAIQKITEAMTDKIRLLGKAVHQNYFKDIRESALKIILNLRRIADKADPDGVDLLRKMVIKNSDSIIQIMDDESSDHKYAKILSLRIAQEIPEKTEKVIPILQKHIETAAANNSLDETDIKIMSWICAEANDQNLETEYIVFLLNHFRNKPEDYKAILACIEGRAMTIKLMGLRQVGKILGHYKFNMDETDILVDKWRYGGGSETHIPEAFSQNVETIKSIEEKRPGIAKFLMTKFGIYNFGRYPTDLLTKQYDEYENQDLPYGLIVFAEDDHNGVYYEYKEELEKVAQELNDKYLIRIAETDGKRDLMRLLVKLRLKYGKNHKISFGILGAHGNQSEITLGNPDNIGDRSIFPKNLIKYGNRKYDLFEENGTLILLSCLSGQKGAIGSKAAESMNVTTIAPKESAGLESIKLLLEDGKLKFKVKYSHHIKAATFRPRRKKKKEFI